LKKAGKGRMRIGLTLQPGQRGTKRLANQYGDRLVCVRYRYDEEKQKRYKTVELIVEEVDWQPPPALTERDRMVYVQVKWGEVEVARRVKEAGGTWNRQKKVWELRYDRVVDLGLEGRIVGEVG